MINEEIIANKKPLFANRKYTATKNPLIPVTRGTMVVDWEATCVDWVHPIKKRVTTTVDGRPAITPPTFVPYFSATIVLRFIQRPPTTNVRINFNKKRP